MKSKRMPPEDSELYRRIYEIAHYMWDPVGVSDVPEAHDEYNSYLTALFRRTKVGDVAGIVEYMKVIETEHMGLSFDEKTAVKAAEAMVAWKDYIEEHA